MLVLSRGGSETIVDRCAGVSVQGLRADGKSEPLRARAPGAISASRRKRVNPPHSRQTSHFVQSRS